MKDYRSALEQISDALHEHDLSIREWQQHFWMYRQQFEEFERLQEMHAERMVFWTRVLAQLQERHNKLAQQARLSG